MMKTSIGIGAIALLGLAVVGASRQGVVPRTIEPLAAGPGSSGMGLDRLGGMPQSPREIARARREIAEAYRYKGTTVVAHPDLDPDDPRVKTVCEMLSRADFVPEQRVRCFSDLDPSLIVVGWHLTVERLDVRVIDSLVRVRVSPLLRGPGGRRIGVLSVFREDYRVAGGKLQFVAAEPIGLNQAIMMIAQ